MENKSQNIRPDKFTTTSMDGITIIKNGQPLNSITETQKKFIWLAFAECQPYSDISKELNISRKELTEWTKNLKDEWQPISQIRIIWKQKKIGLNFKAFYEAYQKIEKNRKCHYCGITEPKIEQLMLDAESNGHPLTKRTRGKKLELDRKFPNDKYDNTENLVYACYWCNNAKTDTFTDEEFNEIGKVISNIWQKRLEK